MRAVVKVLIYFFAYSEILMKAGVNVSQQWILALLEISNYSVLTLPLWRHTQVLLACDVSTVKSLEASENPSPTVEPPCLSDSGGSLS